MSLSNGGGGRDALRHDQRRARRPASSRAFVRPRIGRRLGGVALGIARFVGADVRVVRSLWLLSLPLSLGLTLPGYLVLWLLLPSGSDAAI
ncbi:MAG: PspC domain-containing protein [Trueperaceae bacterium]|nr:PspC domain-containing protein [Trueperaceae bacterium]